MPAQEEELSSVPKEPRVRGRAAAGATDSGVSTQSRFCKGLFLRRARARSEDMTDGEGRSEEERKRRHNKIPEGRHGKCTTVKGRESENGSGVL